MSISSDHAVKIQKDQLKLVGGVGHTRYVMYYQGDKSMEPQVGIPSPLAFLREPGGQTLDIA